jgi:hypothetical protein
MKRSKGTYLQGVIEAEELVNNLLKIDGNIKETLKRKITRDETPSFYYDGKCFCEGFYDYLDYFLDNEELIVYTKTKK